MAWINLKDLFVTRNEWDSVSHSVLYDSSVWHVHVSNGYIWVHAMAVGTPGDSWGKTICPYTLPQQYCPSKTIQAPAGTANGGSWTGTIQITTTGEISVLNYGNAGSTQSRYGFIMYPIGY